MQVWVTAPGRAGAWFPSLEAAQVAVGVPMDAPVGRPLAEAATTRGGRAEWQLIRSGWGGARWERA